MMGTPVKGDKSDGFISTSNSEQNEQTNRENYVFYCSVSQIHINPEKNTKKTHSTMIASLLPVKVSKENKQRKLCLLLQCITNSHQS